MQIINELMTTALPEFFLALVILALIVFGALRGDHSTRTVTILAAASLLVTLGLIMCAGKYQGIAFNNLFISAPITVYGKMLTCFAALLGLALSQRYMNDLRANRFEFPILVLLSVLGMMFLISANNFITMYMGFELMSLSLYILASFRRDSARSAEAGLKYFVLGVLASGFILYGISLFYGYTGTTAFDALSRLFNIEQGPPSMILSFALVFICAGVGFKISAAPFHMWTPDVYQGAATPVTAYFAMAPKIAAFILFARILLGPLGGLIASWQPILLFLAALSLLVGAFAALMQKNIKRLLAYSTIGHVGFILLGIAAGSAKGLEGMLIYLTLYLFMTAGVFAIILSLRKNNGMRRDYLEEINDLRGLSRSHPYLALSMAVLMFSLAGIPPTAGFFAKLTPLVAVLDQHLIWIAVVSVFSSVVSAYYYLRIVKLMYFDEPAKTIDPSIPAEGWEKIIPAELVMVIAISITITIGFIIMPTALTHNVQSIAAAFFQTR